MTQLELLKALRELGATSVEFGFTAGEGVPPITKIAFAVQAQVAVVPNRQTVQPAETRKLTTEEMRDALRRKELGR